MPTHPCSRLTGGRRRASHDFSESAPYREQERDRFKMIQQVEEYLGRFSGVDGHGCMLRQGLLMRIPKLPCAFHHILFLAVRKFCTF